MPSETTHTIIEVQPIAGSALKKTTLFLVSTTENYTQTGKDKVEAELIVAYQELSLSDAEPKKNKFYASYQRLGDTETVDLTASLEGKGEHILEPKEIRGNHVGTYLMSKIIPWVRRWPNAEIKQLVLSRTHAGDSQELNTERRNKFFEKYGIAFNYKDDEHASGTSRPMQVTRLKGSNTWQANIAEKPLDEYLPKVLSAHRSTQKDLEQERHLVKDLKAKIKKTEDAPLTWFCGIMMERYGYWALVLAFIVFFILCVHAVLVHPPE